MKLQPSRIHYSQNIERKSETTNAYSVYAGAKFGHFSAATNKNCNFPKLQVFKKDGCYFALDNNSLSLYRQMELSSNADDQKNEYAVDVVLVSSKMIPKAIFESSVCSADEQSSSSMTESGSESDTGSDDFPHHSTEERNSYDDTVCLACGGRFNGIKELAKHQSTKKHFACAICGNVYSTSNELKTHEDLMNHVVDYSSESD